MREFACPEPITLQVKASAGALYVIAEARDTATVDVTPYEDTEACRDAADRTLVELRGDAVHLVLLPDRRPPGDAATPGSGSRYACPRTAA